MEYKEVKRQQAEISDQVMNNNVLDAFDSFESLIKTTNNQYFITHLSNLKDTYLNILKYSFEYHDDPEKEKIFNKLKISFLELNDEFHEFILTDKLLIFYANEKKENDAIEFSIDEAKSIIQKLEFLELNEEDNQARHVSLEQLRIRVFNLLWLTDKYDETHRYMATNIMANRGIDLSVKILIISAISISLHRYFDIHKIDLLLEFCFSEQEKVWQRSFISLFTGILHYENRILIHKDFYNKLITRFDENKLTENLELIIIQFLKSQDTEKITKKLREEIIPEVMKFRSNLVDKLDLENITSQEDFEDKNPEWQTAFKDSPDLYDKLEEFTKLQLEGSDVFMGTFAFLKHFPFFQSMKNWFTPFYKDNHYIRNSMKSLPEDLKTEKLASGIEKSSFLCNSDKYSFCFNLQYLPKDQRSMVMNLFNMEIEALSELEKSDSLIDTKVKNKILYTQFIQDLYRFYELYPQKKQFHNIFSHEVSITKSEILKNLITSKKTIRNIGEFYFEKEYFKKALEIFIELITTSKDLELLEKIAYCYEQLGQFELAIDFYKKAELLDKNKNWIIQKLAFSYRKKGDFNNAIIYLKESEKLKPEDLYIQSKIGQTYMDLGDYEQALKYYFKIEYLSPDNYKIQRPIAWCSFIMGKLDTSKKYFEKIIKKDGNKYDYMNLGHVYWCLDDVKKAIELYKKSLELSGNNFDWFAKDLKNDSKFLLKQNIKSVDIQIIKDYLKLNY
ncbi:tetratricopeptide repeat protein [Bacteroidota bacterium]